MFRKVLCYEDRPKISEEGNRDMCQIDQQLKLVLMP